MSSTFAFFQNCEWQELMEKNHLLTYFCFINFIVLILKKCVCANVERFLNSSKIIIYVFGNVPRKFFRFYYYNSKDILLCIYLFLVPHSLFLIIFIIDDYFTLNNLKKKSFDINKLTDARKHYNNVVHRITIKQKVVED